MNITHSQGCHELQLTHCHVTTILSRKHECTENGGLYWMDGVLERLNSEKSSVESRSCYLYIFIPEKFFKDLFLHINFIIWASISTFSCLAFS